MRDTRVWLRVSLEGVQMYHLVAADSIRGHQTVLMCFGNLVTVLLECAASDATILSSWLIR